MKYQPGTFITIPNKEILRGKPSELQTIFLWICNYSNDDGTCFPSRKKLSMDTKCSMNTVDKYLNELISLGLITKFNRTKKSVDGKPEKLSNLYQLMIIDYKITPSSPVEQPTLQIEVTPSIKIEALTKPIINSNNLTVEPQIILSNSINNEIPFNSKDELDHWRASNKPWLRLIGIYGKYRRVYERLTTKAQLNKLIPEFRKVAEDLTDFTDEQLKEAFRKCDEMKGKDGEKIEWTLRTVKKVLLK